MLKRHILRRPIACLLACFLAVYSIPSAHASASETTFSSAATIYWVFDPEVYEDLFSSETALNSEDISAVHSITCQTSSVDDSSAFICASYSFDVDGNGPVSPVTITGELYPYSYNDSTIYSGTMTGNAYINGILCSVSAVVDQDLHSSKLHAGVSIIPDTANGLEDYIFFALGDPVITTDMVSTTSFVDGGSVDTPSSESPSTHDVYSSRSLSYTNKASSSSSFSDGYSSLGTAQTVNAKYCSSANRVCVNVTTNASALEQYFSYTGPTTVTVDTLKIGLRMTNSSSVANISNIHSVIETDSNPSSLEISTYLSYLTSLLGDVFGIAGTVISVFDAMLSDLFDDDQISTTLYPTGTNSYVLFDFPTSVLQIRDVDFDDAPMPVEFNLATTSTVTTGFRAYSELSYYIQCIEQTTASLIRLSVACNSVTTATFSLTVSA